MELTLGKAGAAAGSLLALAGLGSLLLMGVEWKVNADDTHQKVTTIQELVEALGDREMVREERAKMAKEKAEAAKEARLGLMKELCLAEVLPPDSAKCLEVMAQ